MLRILLPLAFGLLIAATAEAQTMTELRQLAGCWEMTTGATVVRETWGLPMGNVMIGTSQTMRAEATAEWEFMRIVQTDDDLLFIAQPSGQQEAVFSSKSTKAPFIFENPAHDFPQRVIYRIVSRDSVVARVEGTSNGSVRGFDFKYGRITCEATEPH